MAVTWRDDVASRVSKTARSPSQRPVACRQAQQQGHPRRCTVLRAQPAPRLLLR